MFYIFNSDNGLSIFRILPQNTTRNQSKMFRQMVKNMTIELPKCPETSPLLVGPLKIEFNDSVTLDDIRAQNPALQLGGRWRPTNCIAQQKVAIIIPFRDRESHLKHWLHFLHPILQRQQLDYRVYVINQAGDTTFNKARLMDAGFLEALKEYDYDCFVFHDVDIIPMDDRNTYKCFSQPRHLAVALDKFGFRDEEGKCPINLHNLAVALDKFGFSLPYHWIYGGITALSKEQFMKINGFPTMYWGWGGEDDDISHRLSFKGMSISRPDAIVGRCKMIRHGRDELNQVNPKRHNNLAKTNETMDIDGINSLRYDVISINRTQLHTKITVDIGTP
ncbi:beta-1,4-galactosyltransferase 1-like [Clupea harengus]|uniref:Beta-1,4-galactosyltransferase n=1 Tax=Clupea harengus TaxID=7950 RepID=A0A8M1KBZ5_CLUHA|nr:beta-1,4-galactosyltransferase 1-like [Clupea harengus]